MTSFLDKLIQKKHLGPEELSCYVKDYDSSYDIPRVVLTGVGLRLARKDSKFTRIFWDAYYWFGFANMFVAMWLEAIKMAQTTQTANWGSLEEVVGTFRMMPCIGYLPLGMSKTYKLMRNRSVYKHMIEELRLMWPRGKVSKEEHEVIKSALYRTKYIHKGYFWCITVSMVIFLAPLYIAGMRWYLGQQDTTELPFDYWLPFDPMQKTNYLIILHVQMWHGLLVRMTFTNPHVLIIIHGLESIWLSLCGDLLFCTFVNHITSQFDLLALRIKKLVYVPVDKQLLGCFPLADLCERNLGNKKAMDSHNNNVCEDEYQKELTSIIKRHQTLIRFAGHVEDMYSFALFVHFFNSSIIVCFCGFCSVLVEKWNEMGYKCFLFAVLWETLLLCWYGQKLLESSLRISDAVYNSGWYKVNKKIRTSLLMMIVRSQKAAHVTTYGFSVISLSSFTTLIKTAWSYFTLLVNLYE